jgi:hypothetical protein
MTTSSKKLLQNPALGLAEQVAEARPLCANVERDIFVGLIRVWG